MPGASEDGSSLRLRSAWAGVMFAAAAAAGVAQAQGLPIPALVVINKAQADLQDALTRRHQARSVKADRCRLAEEADVDLSRASLTAAGDASRRSRDAERAAAACDEAGERLENLDQDVKLAARQLRSLTRDAESCGPEPASCAAMREAELERRRAVVSSKGTADSASITVAAAPAAARSPSDVVATLIKEAAGAQERVSTMRAKLANPYKPGDDAVSATLGLSDSEGLAGNADPGGTRRQLLVREAAAAYDESARVKPSLHRAQLASNDLVQAAQKLMLCVKNACKDSPFLEQAERASSRLDSELKAAEDSYTLAQTIARKAQASEALNFDDRLVARSVEFQRLLDKYPDAKSLLGSKSSYLITASKSASSAAIKLGSDKLLPTGYGSFNVVFEAPLNKNGDTNLFTAGEEFTNNASVKASWYRLEGRDSMPSKEKLNLLWANGLSLKWESKPYSFVNAADLMTKSTGRREHWELSAFTAVFPLSDNSNVHQIRLGLRREAEAADTLTRCPASAAHPDTTLKCVTAAFEPPGALQTVRVLSYEYRLSRAKFAVSPRLTLTDAGKTETEFHLPIYLVRDSEKDTQFNAGISLNWNSARPNDRWQLGVFVGAPFSLFQLDR